MQDMNLLWVYTSGHLRQVVWYDRRKNSFRVKAKVVKLWQMDNLNLVALCTIFIVRSKRLQCVSKMNRWLGWLCGKFQVVSSVVGNNEGYSKYCSPLLIIRIDLKNLNFAPYFFCCWPIHVQLSCGVPPTFYHRQDDTLQSTFLFLSQSSWEVTGTEHSTGHCLRKAGVPQK